MEEGADELDMVVNIGKVLSLDWTFVAADIKGSGRRRPRPRRPW